MQTNLAEQSKNKKILLIEDDSFLAGMYVTKLGLEGFATDLAGSGEEGLKIVKEKHPDLIILDILLPHLNGFDVLGQLKSDPATKEIPVLLLTNLGQNQDIEKGLSLGAEDYLVKAHFLPNEVIEKIKKILRG